jgi:hypothetical protein
LPLPLSLPSLDPLSSCQALPLPPLPRSPLSAAQIPPKGTGTGTVEMLPVKIWLK